MAKTTAVTIITAISQQKGNENIRIFHLKKYLMKLLVLLLICCKNSKLTVGNDWLPFLRISISSHCESLDVIVRSTKTTISVWHLQGIVSGLDHLWLVCYFKAIFDAIYPVEGNSWELATLLDGWAEQPISFDKEIILTQEIIIKHSGLQFGIY